MTNDKLSAALSDRYRIERELGHGGMATVVLAHDLKHDRQVAIKVLRPELAAMIGSERFLQEIKTIAHLQHPHILGLIDSGEANGTAYYVMPFVEGESLRDRLQREKQLPIGDAVRLATEVAAALEYAHRHGVIHRDIKPENVMLHDGSALVTDFGIALAVSTAGGTRMTETGMSLGTPQYMSPEQAMGEREITARSDVYALGVMTYEMLVGEPPFTGPTAQSIVAKVLTEEPGSLVAKRHTIPPHVEAAVLTSMEKLPADRFAAAADFARVLTGETPQPVRAPRTPVMRSADRRPLLVVAIMAGVAALLAAWGWSRGRTQPSEVARFTLVTPSTALLRVLPLGSPPLAISPDGRTFVYEGPGQLYRRNLNGLETAPIAGTEGGSIPFFSPDGQWIGFREGGTIKKVPLAGGPAITLVQAGVQWFSAATWTEDNDIVYSAATDSTGEAALVFGSAAIWRVSARGGATPVRILPDTVPYAAYSPMALPGNRGVLFTQCRPDCLTSALAVVDLHTGDVQTLIDGAIGGWYLPDGYLVYAQASGSVFGVRFDVDGLEVKGAAIPLLDGLSMSIVVPLPRMAVSASGTAAYLPGVSPTRRRLVRVHWDGSEDTLSTEARSFDEPRISPSGRQVAVGIWEAGLQQVWIYDIPSGTLTQLNSTTTNTQPTWSSDGKRVAYSAWIGDRGWAVRWRYADRSDEPTVVAPESVLSRRAWDLDWSQEGHWIAAAGVRHRADKDIFAIPAEGHAEMVPVVAAPGNESDPAISPDGHWIAYESGASGTTQVYAHPFPEPGGHWVVSAGLGWDPKWSPDGRSIFYSTGTEIWVASIHYNPLQVTDRRRLFESRMYMRDFDVDPDGRSFIMIREEQPPITDPIVILNWSREIEGRIASQKER